MAKRDPLVVIVGRPNVGKSTLFNRIVGRRVAIIDSQAGITRDRIYATVNWSGRQFQLVDTGGYIPDSQDAIAIAIRSQVGLAIEEADLILFLVDANESIMPMDEQIAQLLRRSAKPVIVVVNKSDSEKKEQGQYEFFRLGLAPVVPVSAANGRRIGDLLDDILQFLPRKAPPEREADSALRLAIVGRPNVGKSSILNVLLGVEKAIVTDIPGTTRDSIDSVLKHYGETIVLIDTAGLRKRRSVKDNVEYYSTLRTGRAIERCNVAVLVVDAVQGFRRQDAHIARDIIERKKGLIIMINKWDLVPKDAHTMARYKREHFSRYSELEHYPLLFGSALTRQRIPKIIELAREVHTARDRRISTHQLNRYFQGVIRQTPPPAVLGKHIKIKYITQVKTAPPVFAFFCNDPRAIKSEYRRFLENHIRNQFEFKGVPLTLVFKQK